MIDKWEMSSLFVRIYSKPYESGSHDTVPMA